jgi:hypothetical protein
LQSSSIARCNTKLSVLLSNNSDEFLNWIRETIGSLRH